MKDASGQRELITAVIAALERFALALASESEPEIVELEVPSPVDEHVLGKRQLQIVELPGLVDEEGMKTADVAAAIDYELPNTYSALQALARNQVVEQVPGKEPQHWRLVRRYRATSRAYAGVAETLRPGEWTRAGDVSIAVRGDTRAAHAVSAANLSHRILPEGHSPAEALESLRAEGVVILPAGDPDPAQRVSWDELGRRVAAARERRSRMAKGTLNYIQVPATDLDTSASFFADVFGWRINRYPAPGPRDDEPQTGYVGFVDSSGQVGGEFVLGRQPSREPGLLPSIHVDNIDDTLEEVVAHGGEVVKPRTAIVEGADWQGIFRDPAGNAFALYEAVQQ